jgi:type I restriction enzyme M protein
VPEEYSWQKLLDAQGDQLEFEYTRILNGLARQPGVIGTIFRKAQNRIQDPAKLKRLVVDLIDKENWSGTGTDIKGDAYEDLLSKGASDKGSGAGQYFTPRALIQAIVDVIQPTVDDSVVDPACGTGGFLLVATSMPRRAPSR